jgi:predicted ATP-binding protein involved in virulence
MDRIKITQLIIENIGPYQKETFDFRIEKGHPDIHILTGANGTGKTTLLHALASTFDYFEPIHKEYLANDFHKRFHAFEKSVETIAKSYIHSVLQNNHKVIEKMACYGCEQCHNLHQVSEKTFSNNLELNRDRTAYQTIPHSKDLIYYKNAIPSKEIRGKKFKFAAFAYSGYRFLKSEKILLNDRQKYNPLEDSLEFVKAKETAFQLSNWIVSRYSKAAIEETVGNLGLAQQYRLPLNLFVKSINELTNQEYALKIETNPWNVGIVYGGKVLEFDVLPDGLRSILSWLGDLLMRLDEIPWEDKTIPITHQNLILFLDEIEVHLHPKWQYKILPVLKNLLPNAQIFLSTHSPFIINSIDNAKIYILETEKGYAKLTNTILSDTGNSYSYIYEHILDAKNPFGIETMRDIQRFNELDAEIVQNNTANEVEFKEVVQRLVSEGEEVMTLISSKLFRLKRITGKNYLNGKNN